MDSKYKKNYLTNVIFNLDFPTLNEYNLDKLKEFQKLIKDLYPILEEIKGVSFEHKLEKEGVHDYTTKELVKYMFFNKTKTRLLTFDSNKLIMDFNDYTHFEEYVAALKAALEGLFKTFPSVISTRVGLRYINQITLNNGSPFEWEKLLEPSLLESIKVMISEKKDISRYINLIELTKDDYRLRFQYGIANSVYPSPIIKKEFTLDYDCYSFESLGNVEEVIEKVKLFNEVIKKMFEESIKDDLRAKMEEIKDE